MCNKRYKINIISPGRKSYIGWVYDSKRLREDNIASCFSERKTELVCKSLNFYDEMMKVKEWKSKKHILEIIEKYKK